METLARDLGSRDLITFRRAGREEDLRRMNQVKPFVLRSWKAGKMRVFGLFD